MLISWRPTPNPDAMRFELPTALPIEDPIAADTATPNAPPLALRLLQIEGVAHCLLARDFVAVTREGPQFEWATLRTEILFSLSDSLARPEEFAAIADQVVETFPLQGDVERQIDELLRTRVAPQVARDGGSIEFVGFADGVVTVRLSGACGGCPSALMTLKRGVETTLMRYVPEIRKVVAEQEHSSGRGGEPRWKAMLRDRGVRFLGDQRAG